MTRRHDTSYTVCAAIGLLLVLALLTTVAALDSPPVPDEPYRGEPPVVQDKLPGEDTPAQGFAALEREALGEFELTAYCPCTKCCGKSDGITATGTQAAEGRTIAVDPSVIPYGSTVTLIWPDGTQHTYTAEDCGGAIRDKRIDVFFESHQAALAFGVQSAMAYLEVTE